MSQPPVLAKTITPPRVMAEYTMTMMATLPGIDDSE